MDSTVVGAAVLVKVIVVRERPLRTTTWSMVTSAMVGSPVTGTVTRIAEGGELGAESSVTKVFWSDLDVALHQTALDLRGPDAELTDAWTEGLLFALGGPIYAGTNEVQRNIIAERLLGLPKDGVKA